MLPQLTWTRDEWRGRLAALPLQSWLARAPKWISIVLILALTALAADLTWLVLTPAPKTAVTSTAPRPAPAARRAPEARFRDVANLHLFGTAPVGVKKGAAQANIQETRLRLTLRGVLASDDPDTSYAIIADEKKSEDYFQTGDTLPGGAQLHAIHADRVILERGGKLEKLMLPKERLKAASASSLQSRPVRSRSRPESSSGGSGGIKQVFSDLKSNPQQFWKNTRIEPVMGKDGAIQGYKINLKDKALMRTLGVRPTDVITSVNGMPLNDPSSLFQLQDLLKELQPFSVTLMRNGQEQTLDVQP